MRTVYFDCVGGAAGDMLLASLVDAGVPAAHLERLLAGLPLDGFRLEWRRPSRGAFAAQGLRVVMTAAQPARALAEVLGVIEGGGLAAGVAASAARVFRRLAAAEAQVHGRAIDTVHFHEVGAVDAIVDIVGCVAALDYLGIEAVRFGRLAPGCGTIDSAHGILPVPAPATLELLRGVPIELGGEPGEWVTPTGAALLVTLGEHAPAGAALSVERVGVGAGSRQRRARPNVVRALVGELLDENGGASPAGPSDPVLAGTVAVLEALLDDQTPEALAHAAERLRGAGALDVVVSPCVMKKGRSGVALQVLAPPGAAERLARLMLAETGTLGVRLRHEARRLLPRRVVTVDTDYGPIRIKETRRPAPVAAAGDAGGAAVAAGGHASGAPEADDVARAARAAGVPFASVAAAARRAYQEGRIAGAGAAGERP